jgi:DNA-binding CsgD family transcriptional regulator
VVVLRETLSNPNNPFGKLLSLPQHRLRGETHPASPQVAAMPRNYRMTRKLSPTEVSQLIDLYNGGLSTYKLARQFGTNRHTITDHLRRGGVTLRSRQKLTPELEEQAKQLYADGHSLAAIGKQVGLTPTAVGNALKRAGVKLRDPHGRVVFTNASI